MINNDRKEIINQKIILISDEIKKKIPQYPKSEDIGTWIDKLKTLKQNLKKEIKEEQINEFLIGGLKVKLNNKMYNINISQFLKEKISPKLVIGGKEDDVVNVITFLNKLKSQIEKLNGYKTIIDKFNEDLNDENIEEKLEEAKKIEEDIYQINIKELYDNIKKTLTESYTHYGRKIPIDGEQFNDDQIKKFIEHQALENNMDLLIDNIEKKVGRYAKADEYDIGIADLFVNNPQTNSDNIDGSITTPPQSLDGSSLDGSSLDGSTTTPPQSKNLANIEAWIESQGTVVRETSITSPSKQITTNTLIPPYRNDDEKIWFINNNEQQTKEFIGKIMPYYYLYKKQKGLDENWKNRNDYKNFQGNVLNGYVVKSPNEPNNVTQPFKIIEKIDTYLNDENIIGDIDILLEAGNYTKVIPKIFYGYINNTQIIGGLILKNQQLNSSQIVTMCFNYLSFIILQKIIDDKGLLLDDYRKFYTLFNRYAGEYLNNEDKKGIDEMINSENDVSTIDKIKQYFEKGKKETLWQNIVDIIFSP